jgi:hypothetical protein
VKLSAEERRRFSDFLTAKDPRYVGWSEVQSLAQDRGRITFVNFEPYYQAYLEFKRAGDIKR